MSLFEDTNPRELSELLRQIHSGEAALPDFQRNFVWDPNETQELIVSIAANYPAGSLLRIRNTNDLFAAREFQGAPPLDGHRATYLVLDGQQRLTSLYQAFYGVGDHRYYVRLRPLIDGEDFDECIFHLRSNTKRAAELETAEAQFADLVLPLRVVHSPGGYSAWARSMRKLAAEGQRDQLEDELVQIDDLWLKAIDAYRFPVVTLSDQTSAEAVCTIFETLNRTSVKLTPFELLTARFWPKNVNLRELWAGAFEKHPIIADFAVDPYYVLQIVALVSRPTPGCKRGEVLALSADAVAKWWDAACEGLAEGLKLLHDDCGVITPDWLPYSTIINPLGAVLTKLPVSTGPGAGANRQKQARWFWCSAFGQTYENAPNSQSVKDAALLSWLDGGPPPETITQLKFDPKVLRDTTPQQRALYRGTIALVLSGDPRDFHTWGKITRELILDQGIDDHHIFPADFLNGRGEPARLRDCVLNRTLIDRKTNQRISNRAPSAYMKEIRADWGAEKFSDLLASHGISSEASSPIWTDDFKSFLGQRQAALWERIKAVTGVTGAADLVEEEAVA